MNSSRKAIANQRGVSRAHGAKTLRTRGAARLAQRIPRTAAAATAGAPRRSPSRRHTMPRNATPRRHPSTVQAAHPLLLGHFAKHCGPPVNTVLLSPFQHRPSCSRSGRYATSCSQQAAGFPPGARPLRATAPSQTRPCAPAHSPPSVARDPGPAPAGLPVTPAPTPACCAYSGRTRSPGSVVRPSGRIPPGSPCTIRPHGGWRCRSAPCRTRWGGPLAWRAPRWRTLGS